MTLYFKNGTFGSTFKQSATTEATAPQLKRTYNTAINQLTVSRRESE